MNAEETEDIRRLLVELECICHNLELYEANEMMNMEGASAPEFFIYDALSRGTGSAARRLRGMISDTRSLLARRPP